MNAIEARAARRRAGKPTLEERLRRDPEMARLIDKHLALLRREQQQFERDATSPDTVQNRVAWLSEAIRYSMRLRRG